LRVVSIADRAAPVEVGFYDTAGYSDDIAIAGSYAYVADYNGLRIIDVSRPEAPVQAGEYASEDMSDISSVAVAGSYAYLAQGSIGLQILDVSNPISPTLVGGLDTPGVARHIVVNNGTAYVADHGAGLRIFDVNDAVAPREIGAIDTPGLAKRVALAGARAFIADGAGGLRAVDARDPRSPVALGAYTRFTGGRSLALDGSYAYVADGEQRLWAIDARDVAAPTERGSVAFAGGATYGVAAAGGYAYVADYSAGLRVIDTRKPDSPVEVGWRDTPGFARDVEIVGSLAYVADEDAGLRVISVADPAQPVEVGFVDPFGSAGSVKVAGNYAYLAYGDLGLRIVDITNPSAPTAVGLLDVPRTTITDVAVAGDYAYGADMWNSARVVNVADRAKPFEVGAYFFSPFGPGRVTASGSLLYVSAIDLTLLDVSVPSQPTFLASYPLSAGEVVVAGDLVYAISGSTGLYILRFARHSNATLTPTATATLTPTPSITASSTATATPTATATATPTDTPTPPPATGDPYEPDDACDQARPIPADGAVQRHTFHKAADADWVAFQAVAGASYFIEGNPVAASPVDLALVPYPACGGAALPGQNYAFSPGVRLQFQATATGPVYLKLVNHDPAVYGPHVAYDLSVRADGAAAQPGALVLVAGSRADRDLQSNIHAVAGQAQRVFLNHGYSADDIRYLATDLTQPGADAFATEADLAAAITEWAAARVGPDRPLTVYLVDHGEYDRFLLDDARGEYLAPDALDGWLAQVEAAHPGLAVNVIIEACQSGSFIDLPVGIARPGRVVITSTGADANAYASPDGAHFSDRFLAALDQNASLYTAFQDAHWGARVATAENQVAWLADDGNARANEPTDGLAAQRRGFGFPGTLSANKWPPYVAEVAAGPVQAGAGTLRARILDDRGVRFAWAVFYPPSYTPPPVGSEWVDERLPTLPLQAQGGDWFAATYAGFTEPGAYRVVIYAQDADGLTARPVAVAMGAARVYVPLLLR
jgi:hypothetical protein